MAIKPRVQVKKQKDRLRGHAKSVKFCNSSMFTLLDSRTAQTHLQSNKVVQSYKPTLNKTSKQQQEAKLRSFAMFSTSANITQVKQA